MNAWQRLLVWLVLVLVGMPGARAQMITGVPDAELGVTVKEIKVESDRYTEKYPQVRGVPEGGTKNWVRITLAYEPLAPKKRYSDPGGLFVNELEFEWTVYVANSENAAKVDQAEGFRAKKKVVYQDILVDNKPKSAEIYIDPRPIERYVKRFKETNVYYRCRIRVGGRTLLTVYGQGNKWSDKEFAPRGRSGENLFEAENVFDRNDALLNRQETPWLYYGEDSFYEKIKPAESAK